MIKCPDLEEWVGEHLDGSLPSHEREGLEAHLDDCRACREFLAAYQRTVRIAKSVIDKQTATATAPEDLIQAILVSLER